MNRSSTFRSANHDYFNASTNATTNDPLYTQEFTDVIINVCELTSQPNISLVDLSEYIHKFKQSTILSILLKKTDNQQHHRSNFDLFEIIFRVRCRNPKYTFTISLTFSISSGHNY